MIPARERLRSTRRIEQDDVRSVGEPPDDGDRDGRRGVGRKRRQELIVLTAGRSLLDRGAGSRAASVAIPSDRSIIAVATGARARPSSIRGSTRPV